MRSSLGTSRCSIGEGQDEQVCTPIQLNAAPHGLRCNFVQMWHCR
jgi:hypothetical protein